jgi:hypothetical protein
VLAVYRGKSDVARLPGYDEKVSEPVQRREQEWQIEFIYTAIGAQSRFGIALFTANFTVLWSSDTFDPGLSRYYHGLLKASFRDRAGLASATPDPSSSSA